MQLSFPWALRFWGICLVIHLPWLTHRNHKSLLPSRYRKASWRRSLIPHCISDAINTTYFYWSGYCLLTFWACTHSLIFLFWNISYHYLANSTSSTKDYSDMVSNSKELIAFSICPSFSKSFWPFDNLIHVLSTYLSKRQPLSSGTVTHSPSWALIAPDARGKAFAICLQSISIYNSTQLNVRHF